MYIRDLEATFNIKDSKNPILKLVEDPEFMLTFNLVSIAKYFNQYAQVDNYMREFTRILMDPVFPDQRMQKRLEQVLTREISISLNQSVVEAQPLAYKNETYALHHNTLAQGRFAYLPASLKAEQVDLNKELQRELAKIREIRDLLISAKQDTGLEARLLSSSQEFMSIVKEIDTFEKVDREYGFKLSSDEGFVHRLEKTRLAINQQTSEWIAQRYGIFGVNMDNIEQVFNPTKSGFFSMHQTRSHLIKNGMIASFADSLAKRYISMLESNQAGNHVFSVIDLFNTSNKSDSAISALMKA